MKPCVVSVIIPVFNGERYLGEAIESVMTQTYGPIEIIVVDDGSTDNSGAVARHYGGLVKYFYQTNQGTAAARNRGVSLAGGSFLAFLDQDDLWLADKLCCQMQLFATVPDQDIVFGHVKQFHSPDLDESMKRRVYCINEPQPGYSPSAMLIKRDAFFRIGLFETLWRVGEWADWYVRAVEQKLNIAMPPDVVALRRLHEKNKGIVHRGEITEYVRILKASLERRRTRNRAENLNRIIENTPDINSLEWGQ
jgi:glycosyltransferase involved in cell wall biosynthesis